MFDFSFSRDVIVSKDTPAVIIAELSCNHNQNIDVAKRLIEEAKKSKANVCKMQIYRPRCMTINHKNEFFKIKSNSPWDGQYLWNLYEKAQTPFGWFPELKKFADDLNIPLFSSAFSKEGFN